MKDDIQNIWRILHSYEAEVFGYIKHAVNSADIARDLYQDVYLIALQNIRQLDPSRSLKNWLMTVARNHVINYYKERNRHTYVALEEEMQQTEFRTESSFNNQIQLALNQLGKRQKEIFIARELDGLSYKELAIKMNLSVSAVTSLIDRARKNFVRAILLNQMPSGLKRNAGKLTLEDLARFVDSFDSLDRLLYRIEKQSQNFFAQIHKNWDDIRNRFLDSDKLNKIMGGFGNRKEKMTLDLGSGTGFIAIHCALNGNTVFSVDLNKAMLSKQMEVKNKLNLNNQYLFQADINKLPFVNYRFDEVFLTLVLHHISDPPGMLKNVAKMVDKNGILIIIDFIRHSNRRFADQMHDLWLGFNPDNLQKWLKPAGLRCENEYVWHSASQIDIFCQVYRKN